MVIYTHGLVPQQGSADMFARAFEIVRPCGAIKYSSLPSPDLNYIVGSSFLSFLSDVCASSNQREPVGDIKMMAP